MDYVKAFVCGGALCLIGQLLIDKTGLTPARILVSYVVAGVVLLQGLHIFFQNRQFIVRVFFLKIRKYPGQDRVAPPRGDSDGELSVGAFPKLFQLPLQILVQLQHFPSGVQVQFPGQCGHQLPLLPLKKGKTGLGFQLQQESAQGGLGYIQPFCRLG